MSAATGSYPRDLIGYNGQPPQPSWPNQARIALSFVLNYEEGGERCVYTEIRSLKPFYLKLLVCSLILGCVTAAWNHYMSMEAGLAYGVF